MIRVITVAVSLVVAVVVAAPTGGYGNGYGYGNTGNYGYGDGHGYGYGGDHGYGGVYGAPTSYSYNYAVKNDYGGNFGHSERSDGYAKNGEFFVYLPDGRLQIIRYYADEYGYHPVVEYRGVAKHPVSHGPALPYY